MTDVPLIAVVDDDEALRESLEGLLKSLGYAVAVFSSAERFLGSEALAKTACLILDVRMPGLSGPELQRELRGQPVRADAFPMLYPSIGCP